MNTSAWANELQLKPGDKVGKYTVVRRLGEGGTSVVFEGHGPDDNEPVALKVLNPSLLDLETEIPRLERQMSLQDHDCPYLIEPLAWFEESVELLSGEKATTLIDVSRLVEGKTLHPQALPEDRIGPVIAMIAEAARYLESRGFYHRDIKPENIVVTPGARKAILLDLGVLRSREQTTEELPATGTGLNRALVTRRYSSPELLEGDLRPGSPPRAWLAHTFYQLGTIIFESITRRRLFEGKREDQLVIAITKGNPFDGCPTVQRRDYESLARTCLSKDPKDRLTLEWSDFACKRHARKPTIVFLYCGGTIGAQTDPKGNTLHPRKLTKTNNLSSRITSRLLRDLNDLAPGLPQPDIEWRFAESQIQIFSENSNPEIWNGLAKAAHRVLSEDWSGKYLLGLVVLHGTDTLAYSAAALQLVFPQLPCPVILTGSNQSPGDDQDVEQSWITSQSDAWSNLFRSAKFLIDGGHRMPMVYIAFANTICHAINARKYPLSGLTLRYAAAFRFSSEEFSYRNFELGKKFAYKYVEDVLVNNFLPMLQQTDYYGPPRPDQAAWERWSLDVFETKEPNAFSSNLTSFSVSPITANSTPGKEMIQIAIAYPSGTLSKKSQTNLGSHSFLITEWGMSPRQTEYAGSSSQTLQATKLFRVLPETALPLLSLAAALNPSDPEQGIADAVRKNPILRSLLGNPLNRDIQRDRADYIRKKYRSQHSRTLTSTFSSTDKPNPPTPSASKHSEEAGLTRRHISFRRHHFNTLLYGIHAPHLYTGSLPEQFGALLDTGFITGVSVGKEWSDYSNSARQTRSWKRFLRSISFAIYASGLARARTSSQKGEKLAWLEIDMKLDAGRQSVYDDSWVLDSGSDHNFLRQLEQGLPLELPDSIGDQYFTNELHELNFRSSPSISSPVSWYVLGILKGALCWALSHDERAPIEGAENMRRRVLLQVLRPRKPSSRKVNARLTFDRTIFEDIFDREDFWQE